MCSIFIAFKFWISIALEKNCFYYEVWKGYTNCRSFWNVLCIWVIMQPLNTKQNENRPPKSTHTFTFSTFLSFIETSQTSFMMCQESTSCLCELFWVQQFDNLIIAMTMQIEFCNEGRIIHTNQTWQQAWVDGKMCLSTEWFIDFYINNSFFSFW